MKVLISFDILFYRNMFFPDFRCQTVIIGRCICYGRGSICLFCFSYLGRLASCGYIGLIFFLIPGHFLFLGYIRPVLTLYTQSFPSPWVYLPILTPYTQSLSFPWVYPTYVNSLHPATFFSLGISDLCRLPIPSHFLFPGHIQPIFFLS